MMNASRIDKLLLSNPLVRGTIETLVLIGTGLLGLVFSWPALPFFPMLNILGVLLLIGGFAFHVYAEKNHKQAHEKSADIVKIVKSGVFAKIRHPLYLGIIVMNLGIALAFGVVATVVIAVASVFHWTLSALREEAFLLQKFGDEYKQYQKQVRWRFLPGIF